MAHDNKRRVVVTGMGAVAPNGIGTQAFWQATRDGIPGITELPRDNDNLPVWVAGSIRNFLAEDYVDRKLANRTDRMTHFAFATIQEAINQAGLIMDQEDPRRVGAVIANAMGGIDFVLKQLHNL